MRLRKSADLPVRVADREPQPHFGIRCGAQLTGADPLGGAIEHLAQQHCIATTRDGRGNARERLLHKCRDLLSTRPLPLRLPRFARGALPENCRGDHAASQQNDERRRHGYAPAIPPQHFA